MTDVFSPEEIKAARRKKKLLLILWFCVLAVYLALAVTLIVVDMRLVSVYRNRDHTLWMGIVFILASVLFGAFSLFFFSIKFRLTRKYVRMLKDMEKGLKDEIIARFVGYDDTVSMKDGVYFYSMILDAKPLKREDITERKMLIEHTKPKIELTEGTKLKIRSHANILLSYEILEPAPKKTDRVPAEETAEETAESEGIREEKQA